MQNPPSGQIDYQAPPRLPDMTSEPHRHLILVWIAIYKFLKVAFTFTGGIAALHLVHRDLPLVIHHLMYRLNFAPEGHFATWLLARALHLNDRTLRLIAAGFFTYAILYAIEGVGLYLHKRWAEWLTVITSCLLVPLEVYHLFLHPSALKLGIVVLNLAIIVYLASLLKREARPKTPRPGAEAERSRSGPAHHPAPAPLR